MPGDIVLFIVLVVAPMALLAFIRPMGRLAFFLLGLLFFLILGFLPIASGPHDPMLVVPFLGLLISCEAAIAEALVRLIRLVRRRAREHKPFDLAGSRQSNDDPNCDPAKAGTQSRIRAGPRPAPGNSSASANDPQAARAISPS